MLLTTEDTEDTESEGKRVDRISAAVIGCAIDVHRFLGPGLLESAYEICLAHELMSQGHQVERQRQIPVLYRGTPIDCGYRLDLVVDDVLIVEVKAVESLQPIHSAQLLSYLRLSGLPLGLLINFNVGLLKQGVRRLKPFPSVSVSSVSSVVQPTNEGE
jgi:GxxExxY protein